MRNDGDRSQRSFAHRAVDQEPLSVTADRVSIGRLRWVTEPGSDTRLKEGSGKTGLEHRSLPSLVRFHLDRHQCLISRKVEQFAAIATPVWLPASLIRNAPLAIGGWKVGYVNFLAPRFIGRVRDPPGTFSGAGR